MSDLEFRPYLERFTIDASKVCLVLFGYLAEGLFVWLANGSELGLLVLLLMSIGVAPNNGTPATLLQELLAELGGKPDFIIGNYSDGNLVATLMSHRQAESHPRVLAGQALP